MSHQSISKKNKYHSEAMHKMSMTIGEYVERCEERRNAPGRMVNGVMEVFIHGHWISMEEFDTLLPPPIVHSFSNDTTNVDKTRSWML